MVFVIHGIRDLGHWTSKIARKVLMRARKDGREAEFAVETSPYGFFPMLPFVLTAKRREKVEWLMDQYAEAVARYPNGNFHFVGHSNGTYCLAKALELYPCCRFRRVVFAGSVVPQAYDWGRFLPQQAGQETQVEEVLNYVATTDWVVAGFPRLFEWLADGFRRLCGRAWISTPDLGGAGHSGFSIKDSYCSRVHNVCYIRGRHSAALNEANWSTIAEFIYGTRPISGAWTPPSLAADRQNPIVKFVGHWPIIAWAIAALLLIFGGYVTYLLVHAMVMFIGGHLAYPDRVAGSLDAVAATLGAVAAVFAVWKVITKL